MGYSCPVCDDPQADGVHLANHLAFTSMVRGGDHEAWLDEHVPGWSSMSEEELAAEITADADETEYPQVFEDTTDDGHSHSHGQDGEQHSHETGASNDSLPPGTTVPDSPFDDETAEILQEAQELTQERRDGSDPSENDGQDADSDDSETE